VRQIVSLISAAFLVQGCAHAKHLEVASFDKINGTVTIQGGKWASQGDYQSQADEYCGHEAKLMSMNQTSDGQTVVGDSTFAVSRGNKRFQYTFSCK
jgi:hypothetical protein